MLWLNSSVICDAVSSGEHGKYNCEGIYPRGVIFVDDFQAPIYVSFYVEVGSDQFGLIPMRFELENRALGRVYQSFGATLAMNGNESEPLYGGPYPIHATGPGVIIFSVIVDGQRVDLATIYLNQKAPTALLPPS